MEYHVRLVLIWCAVLGMVALSVSSLFCAGLAGLFEPGACNQIRESLRSVASWIPG
jgi:hypothetical protein